MNGKVLFCLIVLALAVSVPSSSHVSAAEDESLFLPMIVSGGDALESVSPAAGQKEGGATLQGRPWRDHLAPYTFRFNNHKDQHQQAMSVRADAGSGKEKQEKDLAGTDKLNGFLYVEYTGELNDGLPVAKHVDCNADGAQCQVGWIFHGVAQTAKLVSKGQGRPQWCIEGDSTLLGRGYTHFHWMRPAQGGGLQVDHIFNGYLLRLVTRDNFVFMHSGNGGGGGQPGGSGGGCSGGGHDGGTGDDGGCSHDDTGDSTDDGGCSDGGSGGPPDNGGGEPGDTHDDDGGCSHDDNGDGSDDGGCSDGGSGGPSDSGGGEPGDTHDDDGGCSHDDTGDSTDDGGCSDGGSGGPPDNGGGAPGGTHDDGGGCSHDDTDGGTDPDGGCSGDDHHAGGPGSHGAGILITPGVDLTSHANVEICP